MLRFFTEIYSSGILRFILRTCHLFINVNNGVSSVPNASSSASFEEDGLGRLSLLER